MARGGPLVVMEMARGGPIVVMEMANDKADDLSSNRLSSFLSKVPEADNLPTWIPPWLATGNSHQGVDKQDLGKVVERLLRESLAPSSRRVYCSTQNRYLTFYSEDRVQPLPTNEETL